MSSAAFRVFIVALLMRLALVTLFPDLIAEPMDKLERYDAIALSLARGEGFSLNKQPTAIAPPIYPAFLSMIYSLFGYSKTVSRIFLALIGAGHCVLVYEVARVFFGGRIPVLAATVLALHPSFVALVFTGTSEAIFVPLHTLFIYALCFAFHRQTARGFLLSGILLGAATLTRGVSLILPVFIAPAFLLLHPKTYKQSVLYFAVFTIGFAFALAPWIARNYVVFDRFVPIQTHGGIHFYWATPAKRQPGSKLTDRKSTENMDEVAKDHYYYSRGFQRIREAPLQLFSGMGRRFLYLWYKTHSGTHDNMLRFLNGGVLILGVAGIISTRKRWRELLPVSSVMAYYVIIHTTVLIALARYILPVIPILVIFAMVPVNDLLNRIPALKLAVFRMRPTIS